MPAASRAGLAAHSPRCRVSVLARPTASLRRVVGDLEKVHTFCHDYGLDVCPGSIFDELLTVDALLDRARLLFSADDVDLFVLFYAGHGRDRSGNWILSDGDVAFSQVLDIWQHRSGARGARCVLMVDACHSGEWAANAQFTAVPSFMVQTSCGPDQKALDGVFIALWLLVQRGEVAPEHALAHLKSLGRSPCTYMPASAPSWAGQAMRFLRLGAADAKPPPTQAPRRLAGAAVTPVVASGSALEDGRRHGAGASKARAQSPLAASGGTEAVVTLPWGVAEKAGEGDTGGGLEQKVRAQLKDVDWNKPRRVTRRRRSTAAAAGGARAPGGSRREAAADAAHRSPSPRRRAAQPAGWALRDGEGVRADAAAALPKPRHRPLASLLADAEGSDDSLSGTPVSGRRSFGAAKHLAVVQHSAFGGGGGASSRSGRPGGAALARGATSGDGVFDSTAGAVPLQASRVGGVPASERQLSSAGSPRDQASQSPHLQASTFGGMLAAAKQDLPDHGLVHEKAEEVGGLKSLQHIMGDMANLRSSLSQLDAVISSGAGVAGDLQVTPLLRQPVWQDGRIAAGAAARPPLASTGVRPQFESKEFGAAAHDRQDQCTRRMHTSTPCDGVLHDEIFVSQMPQGFAGQMSVSQLTSSILKMQASSRRVDELCHLTASPRSVSSVGEVQPASHGASPVARPSTAAPLAPSTSSASPVPRPFSAAPVPSMASEGDCALWSRTGDPELMSFGELPPSRPLLRGFGDSVHDLRQPVQSTDRPAGERSPEFTYLDGELPMLCPPLKDAAHRPRQQLGFEELWSAAAPSMGSGARVHPMGSQVAGTTAAVAPPAIAPAAQELEQWPQSHWQAFGATSPRRASNSSSEAALIAVAAGRPHAGGAGAIVRLAGGGSGAQADRQFRWPARERESSSESLSCSLSLPPRSAAGSSSSTALPSDRSRVTPRSAGKGKSSSLARATDATALGASPAAGSPASRADVQPLALRLARHLAATACSDSEESVGVPSESRFLTPARQPGGNSPLQLRRAGGAAGSGPLPPAARGRGAVGADGRWDQAVEVLQAVASAAPSAAVARAVQVISETLAEEVAGHDHEALADHFEQLCVLAAAETARDILCRAGAGAMVARGTAQMARAGCIAQTHSGLCCLWGLARSERWRSELASGASKMLVIVLQVAVDADILEWCARLAWLLGETPEGGDPLLRDGVLDALRALHVQLAGSGGGSGGAGAERWCGEAIERLRRLQERRELAVRREAQGHQPGHGAVPPVAATAAVAEPVGAVAAPVLEPSVALVAPSRAFVARGSDLTSFLDPLAMVQSFFQGSSSSVPQPRRSRTTPAATVPLERRPSSASRGADTAGAGGQSSRPLARPRLGAAAAVPSAVSSEASLPASDAVAVPKAHGTVQVTRARAPTPSPTPSARPDPAQADLASLFYASFLGPPVPEAKSLSRASSRTSVRTPPAAAAATATTAPAETAAPAARKAGASRDASCRSKSAASIAAAAAPPVRAVTPPRPRAPAPAPARELLPTPRRGRGAVDAATEAARVQAPPPWDADVVAVAPSTPVPKRKESRGRLTAVGGEAAAAATRQAASRKSLGWC